MSSYVVAYDLMKQGQNYNCIVTKLEKEYGAWHMQQSVWILISDQSAVQIRDSLALCLDQNDKLFVGRFQGGVAWKGFGKEVNDWLKANL